MSDINHRSGMLTGDGPILDRSPKTVGELEDERETTLEQHANKSFDDEDDGIPAVEQRQQFHGVMISPSTQSSKPKLEVNPEFAAEMHAREAKEKAEREKKRQAAEAEEKKRAEEHEKEIATKLEHALELDPDEIREQTKEENYKQNQAKLYPDAVPVANDIEQKVFEKDEGTGNQIAGRAKLEFVFDEKLKNDIIIAGSLSFVGFIFTLIGIITTRAGIWLERIFLLIGIATFITSIILLSKSANKKKHREIPSEQAFSFFLATVIPFIVMRIPFIIAGRLFPIAGHLVGPAIGCAIASSFHYAYLNHYGITASVKHTLINFAVFVVIYVAALIGTAQDFSSVGNYINVLAVIGGYLFGDLLAMRLAWKTSK